MGGEPFSSDPQYGHAFKEWLRKEDRHTMHQCSFHHHKETHLNQKQNPYVESTKKWASFFRATSH